MTTPESNGQTSIEKQRLKKLVSSEALDQLMQVASSKVWIALYTCFALLLTALIWSVAGSIPVKVNGVGISRTESGPFVIIASQEGTVTEVFVDAGQFIEKGTLIAKAQNSTLQLNIDLKKGEITQKQNELHTLAARIEEERRAKESTLAQEKDSALTKMKVAEGSLPFLKKDLEAKKRLAQKGIIPPPKVEEAKNKIHEAEIEIENSKANLARIQEDMERSYRVDEIIAKQDEIVLLQGDLDRLLLQAGFLEIHSEKSGRILEVLIAPGDRVLPGQEISSLEIPVPKGQGLQYYATFPAQYGELLDVNLPVEIEVSGVDPKLYGFLQGKVKFISPYPVTMEELKSDVRNSEIAAYLKGMNQVVYSAIISLDRDPATKSGYKWSTDTGPPWELSSGTIGNIKTIVERKAPIIYILPLRFSPYVYNLIKGDNDK